MVILKKERTMHLVKPLQEIEFVSKANVCLGVGGGEHARWYVYMYIHAYIQCVYQMNIFVHIPFQASPNIFLG